MAHSQFTCRLDSAYFHTLDVPSVVWKNGVSWFFLLTFHGEVLFVITFFCSAMTIRNWKWFTCLFCHSGVFNKNLYFRGNGKKFFCWLTCAIFIPVIKKQSGMQSYATSLESLHLHLLKLVTVADFRKTLKMHQFCTKSCLLMHGVCSNWDAWLSNAKTYFANRCIVFHVETVYI